MFPHILKICRQAQYMEQRIFIARKSTNKQASNIMCYVLYVGGKNRLIHSVYIFETWKILESSRSEGRWFFNWKTCDESASSPEVLKTVANELILVNQLGGNSVITNFKVPNDVITWPFNLSSYMYRSSLRCSISRPKSKRAEETDQSIRMVLIPPYAHATGTYLSLSDCTGGCSHLQAWHDRLHQNCDPSFAGSR